MHAVPNLQGMEATLLGAREGWAKVQLGRVHAAPYRQGVGDCGCEWVIGGAGDEYVLGFSCSALGFSTAGLTCALIQSLSLQFLPFTQASLLKTTPLSGVATGDGWEYRQSAFVHFRPNLQSVGDCGRSGGTNAGWLCVDPLVEGMIARGGATWTGVGASTADAGALGVNGACWAPFGAPFATCTGAL